jgi:hypothetical protein
MVKVTGKEIQKGNRGKDKRETEGEIQKGDRERWRAAVECTVTHPQDATDLPRHFNSQSYYFYFFRKKCSRKLFEKAIMASRLLQLSPKSVFAK